MATAANDVRSTNGTETPGVTPEVAFLERLMEAHMARLSPELRALIEGDPELTRAAVRRHFSGLPTSARVRRARG